MIKRLLLLIAVFVMSIEYWLIPNAGLGIGIAIIGIVLLIAVSIRSMGCAGVDYLFYPTILVLTIAFFILFIKTPILIEQYRPLIDSLCYIIITDKNGTIISNTTVICP